MRFWPWSVIASSPLLPAMYAPEVAQAPDTYWLSEGAFLACHAVCRATEPLSSSNLFIIHGTDPKTPLRLAYVAIPDPEDFGRLERAGVYADDKGVWAFLDALH